jgi:hypothetical protein
MAYDDEEDLYKEVASRYVPEDPPVSYEQPDGSYGSEAPANNTPPSYQTEEPGLYQPPQARFPGLPVIVNAGEASYNGRSYGSEEQAFQARAQHAQDPRAQAAFQAQEQQRAQARQEPGAETPEMTSIQIRQEMGRNQLSRADQIELAQTQNGIARVKRDAREGRVPMTQAQQLIQQLEGRANPLMIRQSTAVALGQLYQRQILQERAQQMQMLTSQRENYQRATIQGPQLSPDGQWVRTASDRWQHVSEVRQPAQGRDQNQLSPQTLNQIHHDVESQVDHMMNPSGGRTFEVPSTFTTIPGETPEARRERFREEQIQQRYGSRIRRMGAGEQAPDLTPFDQREQQVHDNPQLRNDRGVATLAAIRRARVLFTQARGNPRANLPAQAFQEYLQLNTQINSAVGAAAPARDTTSAGLRNTNLGDLTQFASPP